MSILKAIVSGIARILHPDKPREWFENVRFPTDLSPVDVAVALDEAAKANPGFKNWRTSIVDLMKLSHAEDPDGAASLENRTALAVELGCDDYTGTAAQNEWLRVKVLKAIEQRGIPLPS